MLTTVDSRSAEGAGRSTGFRSSDAAAITGEPREWMRHHWMHVRVEDACLTDDHRGPLLQVWVHLGALLPADVRVEVVPGAPPPLNVSPGPRGRVMWSVRSYHNGSYLFEMSAFDPAGSADGCTVRIAAPLTSPGDVPPRPLLHFVPLRSTVFADLPERRAFRRTPTQIAAYPCLA